MSKPPKSLVLTGGLALFSMFFGAGNVVFPILLGQFAGSSSPAAILGFFFGGVLVPFLGLIGVMMYAGNVTAFFRMIGRRTGMWVLGFLVLILGPFGAIPRLIAISYETISPYLPGCSLPVFSAFSCLLFCLLILQPKRLLTLLAYVLTPALLTSLTILIAKGVLTPKPLHCVHPPSESFFKGISLGYGLLDLLAAFLYATVILDHFHRLGKLSGRALSSKMLKASILAISMLAIAYVGLTYMSAYHAPAYTPDGDQAGLIRIISIQLLGPVGGVIACIAVSLACLTTAISNTAACAAYIRREFFLGKIPLPLATAATLLTAYCVSILGFRGISSALQPVLNLIHPGLILLCLVNIALRMRTHRLVPNHSLPSDSTTN